MPRAVLYYTRIVLGAVGLSMGLLGMGCNSFETTGSQRHPALSSTKNTGCVLPAGVSGSPKTIEQFVAMVNSLPKPVTVDCVVAVLDRPLEVSLTSNMLSAQPAMGERSPRIFIMKDNLYISIVPEGDPMKVVELSFFISDTESIKAEIPFPVTANIAPKDPYEHILGKNGGTVCGVCHRGEIQTSSPVFTDVFSSTAFQPRPETLVDLEQFRGEKDKCRADLEPERCAIIRAFFGFGEVKTKAFPTATPFFF